MDERYFTVATEEDGQRLDKLICLHFEDLTRSAVQKQIECGNVFVNERPVAKSYKPKTGDSIALSCC